MSDSPTARALRALELLQTRPGITAEQLGDRLGVTERAARRYVATLREAGIPVISTTGPAGGYRLGRGVRLPPLVFSQTEALALVMAALDGHHDPDGDTPVGHALRTLLRALPEPVAAQAEAVRRAATPAPDRSAARPDPAVTVALVQACAERRRLRLGYRSEHGERTGTVRELEVEPWSVVVRHGRWYLLCRSVTADAVRTYRVDRVTSVQMVEGEVRPPDDLDPVALLEEHLGAGWEHPTEVLIKAPFEQAGARVPRSLGRLEAVDEATTRLVGTTSNLESYAIGLIAAEVPFTVLGGPELRAAVREIARRLLAATPDPRTSGPDPARI